MEYRNISPRFLNPHNMNMVRFAAFDAPNTLPMETPRISASYRYDSVQSFALSAIKREIVSKWQ